jgi:hypothetical protein
MIETKIERKYILLTVWKTIHKITNANERIRHGDSSTLEKIIYII